MKRIESYRDLEVYKIAMDASMEIFELAKDFPIDERYSLTDQIRRSSRSVCANIAEAWRKRRYKLAFVSKLSDAETEAAETQVWLEYCWRCQYIGEHKYVECCKHYDHIIGKLVRMIDTPGPWLINTVSSTEKRRRGRG